MRGFIFDLDGCVWTGDVLMPGASEVLALLRSQGRALTFLTNNSRARAATMQAKLERLGVQATVSEVLTPLEILGRMKLNQHVDPDLFDVFVRRKVYRRYAEMFLQRAEGAAPDSLAGTLTVRGWMQGGLPSFRLAGTVDGTDVVLRREVGREVNGRYDLANPFSAPKAEAARCAKN